MTRLGRLFCGHEYERWIWADIPIGIEGWRCVKCGKIKRFMWPHRPTFRVND